MRSTWVRAVPIARRMPISFDFCTTDTTSTLAMPSATVIPTKIRMRVLARICADIALKNCALVLIQLSTRRSPPSRTVLRDRLRGERVVHLDVEARGAAREVEQVLRGAQRHVDVALVDALVAEIEDADHDQRRSGAVRGVQRELVADAGAEILGELGADDDVDRPHVVAARDDLLRQGDDA